MSLHTRHTVSHFFPLNFLGKRGKEKINKENKTKETNNKTIDKFLVLVMRHWLAQQEVLWELQLLELALSEELLEGNARGEGEVIDKVVDIFSIAPFVVNGLNFSPSLGRSQASA